jgi:hypothetical protein
MRFENYRWLLIPVMAIHNLEEWATVPVYGSITPSLTARGVVPHLSWRVLEVGWVIVTLVPAVLVVAAARARQNRILNVLICWVASMYLANALVPHGIELVIGRTCAPGDATAFLVSLPFCSLMLRQAVRENTLTSGQVVAVAALGFVSIFPVLAAVVWVASAIT